MKKEYISPEAIAIKIQTAGMLAVSGFEEIIDSGNEISDPGDLLAPQEEFDFEDDFEYDE